MLDIGDWVGPEGQLWIVMDTILWSWSFEKGFIRKKKKKMLNFGAYKKIVVFFGFSLVSAFVFF